MLAEKGLAAWAEFYSNCLKNANIAVIGGGGKTGLIGLLATRLKAGGRATLVTVTTRLGREQLPLLAKVEVADLAEAEGYAKQASQGQRLLVAGPFESFEKLAGLPISWFPAIRRAAGPETIFLIEADGSAGLPLKAHREDEPVLPPLSGLFTVAVIGLSALLYPWPKAVHRPEILARHIKLPPAGEALSPRMIADFIGSAWRRFNPDILFLNQADLLRSPKAKELAAQLESYLKSDGWVVFTGSLKELS